MSFVSFQFAVFFIAVFLLRCCFRDFKAEKWFLIGASYLFVASWSITSSFLLLLVSLVTCTVALGFSRLEGEHHRKILLVISVTAIIGVLFSFKYSVFLYDIVTLILNSFGISIERWPYEHTLPVGISFFTFIALTYVIDSYLGKLLPHDSPQDVFLFVGYFPQILSGPINRAVDMMPQLKQRARATALEFESGLAQFGLGAVKKIVISDQIAPHVNLIFSAPGNYDGLTLLQGLLGYTVQIYCDFSGYADMAIGCARMMGFRFMENFQMPYSAVNITEFWQRWHISLSTWLRDYLYIPIGGNRKGLTRTYLNLILTMLLCGLWHGASWNFVFWGGFHGAALAIHRVWKNWAAPTSLRGLPGIRLLSNFLSRVLTLGVVALGWLFFRADSWSSAAEYLTRLITWNSGGIRMLSPYIIASVAAMVLVHLIIKKDNNWVQQIPQLSVPVRVFCYTSILLLIVCLGATESAPFIYMQF